MSATPTTDVTARFLDALAARDFGALAATFADHAGLRGLAPSRVREEHGSEAIAERFQSWFGDTDECALVKSRVEELADVVRTRWRVAGMDQEVGPCVTEQTAYAAVDGGRSSWMSLVRSGDRPLPR
jgi:hypothetical protein